MFLNYNKPNETPSQFNSGNVPPNLKDSEAEIRGYDYESEERIYDEMIQEEHDRYDSWKDEILANEPINEDFNNHEGGMQC